MCRGPARLEGRGVEGAIADASGDWLGKHLFGCLWAKGIDQARKLRGRA